MSEPSQISATISAATKERLDAFTESHGLRKNYVVEQALLYFIESRRELPDEALVPTRLVLEERRFFVHHAGQHQFKPRLAVT